MEYLIKVTEEDISLISSSLGELPYKVVAPLMDKIHDQMNDQDESEEDEEVNHNPPKPSQQMVRNGFPQ